jgi:hypothetical protein
MRLFASRAYQVELGAPLSSAQIEALLRRLMHVHVVDDGLRVQVELAAATTCTRSSTYCADERHADRVAWIRVEVGSRTVFRLAASTTVSPNGAAATRRACFDARCAARPLADAGEREDVDVAHRLRRQRGQGRHRTAALPAQHDQPGADLLRHLPGDVLRHQRGRRSRHGRHQRALRHRRQRLLVPPARGRELEHGLGADHRGDPRHPRAAAHVAGRAALRSWPRG